MFKVSSFVVASSLIALLPISTVFAAAPDGIGPWADSVALTAQGLRNDGSAVPAIRSNPTSMLGVAENDTVEGHFYSLGFGGVATLHFDNGISTGAMIVEATNPNYPNESANVEVSSDNVTWIPAGNVVTDGTVDIPENSGCIHYVRITDASDPSLFKNITNPPADAYDVDGVQAQGDLCVSPSPTPLPSPSPSIVPSPSPSVHPSPSMRPYPSSSIKPSPSPKHDHDCDFDKDSTHGNWKWNKDNKITMHGHNEKYCKDNNDNHDNHGHSYSHDDPKHKDNDNKNNNAWNWYNNISHLSSYWFFHNKH